MVGCSDDGQTIVGRWSDGRLEARTFGRLDRGMVEDTVGDLGGRTVRRSDGWAIAGVLCQTAGYWVGRSGGGLEVRKVVVRRWERQWAGSDGWCGDWMGSRTPGQCGNRTSHPMVGRSDGRTIRWMAVYSAVGWVGRLDGGSDDWTVGRAIDVTDNLGLAPSSKELTENMMSCCGQRPAS